MNTDLNKLQPYPFTKLRALLAQSTGPDTLAHIDLSVGEPKHPAPEQVKQALIESLSGLSQYPGTRGVEELRKTIAQWLLRRFSLNELPAADSQILPVNGTREALFAFAQTVVERTRNSAEQAPVVVTPNPFYQIYEGAALLAGAETHLVDCTAENLFTMNFTDVPAAVWRRCQLVYICTPGNPTGAVFDISTLQTLIELADRHDFVIASDECYSEIYFDEAEPPAGLLEACARLGRNDYKRCVVFHSLSKRSNLPGLRSGFVAGDAALLDKFFLYRTYHGCSMPLQHQRASIAAWEDETHVQANRALYREKFDAVLDLLTPVMDIGKPQAGFYLWPKTPLPDDIFARDLYATQHVTVLPGSYLGRGSGAENPGNHRIRMALVAPVEQCREAAQRIRTFVESL